MKEPPQQASNAGVLLEQVLAEYRRRFLPLVGIMLPPAALAAASSLLSRGLLPAGGALEGAREDPLGALIMLAWLLPAAGAMVLVTWLVEVAALGAMSRALQAGEGPVTGGAVEAYAGLTGMAGRILGLALALFALAGVLPALVGAAILGAGFLVGAAVSSVHPLAGGLAFAAFGAAGFAVSVGVMIFVAVRYAVAVPALTRSGGGVLDALGESASLTAGRRMRVLLVCFLTVLAASVATFVIQAPATVLTFVAGGSSPLFDALAAVSAAAAVLLAGPLPLLAVVVLHRDLSREGRDPMPAGPRDAEPVYTPGR